MNHLWSDWTDRRAMAERLNKFESDTMARFNRDFVAMLAGYAVAALLILRFTA